ncbi:MAG TPA: hypothetical protein VK348_05640, partial [Planctomycetota bacterium]|nr:hypothetical protein [Planctomycetota bacterium]
MKLLCVATDGDRHRSRAALPARRRRSLPATGLLALVLLGASARTQGNQGAWEPAFDHELNTLNTNQLVVPPLWVWPSNFNALHMALIPIGPYRGMVMAWDVADGLTLRPYQRWTIIDPAWTPGSGRVHFRNFFLQMPQGVSAADLFCAGHAWGSDGRMFVAGGTTRYGSFDGSSLVYQFCPDLYDLGNQDFGVWLRQPDMANTRWYPTITVMADGAFLITGGTNASVIRNDYEVYRIAHPGQVPPDTAVPDQRSSGNDRRVYDGPTGPATFDNYPRVFLLSTGQVFSAGFNYRGFRWTHVPSQQPIYDFSSGTGNGYDLNYPTCVLDPRGGGGDDRMLRMGGLDVFGATYEVVSCVASQPGPWLLQSPPFQLAHARWVAMGLPLPDAE